MKATIPRDWATPMTIATFVLMATTGLLMFFHLNNPLQETLHAWIGWVMVVAVLLHAAANWFGFKRYFQSLGRAPAIMSLVALLFAGSFVFAPAGEGEMSVPAVAINALAEAPLRQVAPLFGKSAGQARQELAAAGIVLPDDDTPIARVAAGSREKVGRALQVLAHKAAP